MTGKELTLVTMMSKWITSFTPENPESKAAGGGIKKNGDDNSLYSLYNSLYSSFNKTLSSAATTVLEKLQKSIKNVNKKTIVFILTLVVFVGAAMYVRKKVYDKKQSNPTMSIWDALKELTTSDFPAFTNEQAERGRDAIDEALKYASEQQKRILRIIKDKINASEQQSGGSEQQSGGSPSKNPEEIITILKEGNPGNLPFSSYSPQDIIKSNSSKLFVTDQMFSAIQKDLAEKGIIFIYEKI